MKWRKKSYVEVEVEGVEGRRRVKIRSSMSVHKLVQDVQAEFQLYGAHLRIFRLHRGHSVLDPHLTLRDCGIEHQVCVCVCVCVCMHMYICVYVCVCASQCVRVLCRGFFRFVVAAHPVFEIGKAFLFPPAASLGRPHSCLLCESPLLSLSPSLSLSVTCVSRPVFVCLRSCLADRAQHSVLHEALRLTSTHLNSHT
jgi:hypothetical protein